MSLSKEQRDNLPESDFAVPGKRALPMHDEKHTRMAWDMVDKKKGLSDEEKNTARERILKRAHELGIDTSDWNKIKAMRIESMALEMPSVPDHPNRIPFSGILTRIDEPSDKPPGGGHGKRVMIPMATAEKALSSLLGMGVDFTPELNGHDAQSKIGLITEANIQGNAIHIAGFFYGADFPTEVETIQANKSKLGFSFEAQSYVRSLSDDPLVIEKCVFTGAAILFKDKAAYTTTSIHAQAETDMSEEILNKLTVLEAQNAELKAQVEKLTVAAASVGDKVKPHAERLRAAADCMEADAIGLHSSAGHVSHLRKMAASMEADAAVGKMPHVYYNSDVMHAGAEQPVVEDTKAMDALKEQISALETKVTDVEKQKFDAAAEPERKTYPPHILNLLAKAGIEPGNDKFSPSQVSDMLKKANVNSVNAIAIKTSLAMNNALNEGVK